MMEKIAIRQWAIDKVLSLYIFKGFKNIEIADIIKDAKELEKYLIGSYQ